MIYPVKKCCNELFTCYGDCYQSKNRCDIAFTGCMIDECKALKSDFIFNLFALPIESFIFSKLPKPIKGLFRMDIGGRLERNFEITTIVESGFQLVTDCVFFEPYLIQASDKFCELFKETKKNNCICC